MPKYRYTYECPVCSTPVKRLTPHIKLQHLDVMGSEYFCRLYANRVQLRGQTRSKGRFYKICPIEACPVITADIPLHLRGRAHCCTRERSLALSRMAQRVEDHIWSIPPRAPTGQPDPFTSSDSSPCPSPSRPVVSPALAGGSGEKGRSVVSPLPELGSKPILLKKIFKVRLLDNWQSFLQGSLGGALSKSRAQETVRSLSRYLRYNDILSRPHLLPEYCSISVLHTYISDVGKDKGPSWGKNVIYVIRKFLVYLEDRGLCPVGTAHNAKEMTRGALLSLGRQKTRARIISQTVKRKKILKINIKDFFQSPARRSSLALMSTSVNGQVYTRNLKYMVASLILNSGARTGAIANLTIPEVLSAEKLVTQSTLDPEVKTTSYLVSVSHHKTAYQGPMQIPLNVREYKALRNMCLFVKSQFPESTSPFVTGTGIKMSTSRLSREWKCAWRDSGLYQKYGAFTPTDHRKHVVSTVLERFPELREKLSKQLKHAASTERQIYDLGTAKQNALDILETRQSMFTTAEVTHPNPEPLPIATHPNPCTHTATQMDPEPATKTKGPDVPAATHPDPEPEEPEAPQPAISTLQRVATWVENNPAPSECLPEEEEEASVNLSSSLFTSVSQIHTSKGKNIQRRHWDLMAEEAFLSHWKLEVELSSSLNKKPTLTSVRAKLALMPHLAEIYKDLTPANIKDKIWSLSRKQRRLSL